MNVLPLIFTFLIIFTCISSTFLKEVKSFSLSETIWNSACCTEGKVNRQILYKTYKKKVREPVEKKESAPKRFPQAKKRSPYFSRRSFFPPFESSKFNIGPLLKNEGELRLHPLYEPLAELLRLLYEAPLKECHSEKIEYRLLEAILTKARQCSEAKELSELSPDDPVLRKLYYKLLKGTNQYSQKGSIPPLRD